MNLIDGIKSDWIYINGFRRIIGAIGKFDPEAEYTLADAMEEAVDDHDDRVFISFEGQDISYAEFETRANQFAHWGLSAGLKKGDCVALFMENRPDYIAFWAGHGEDRGEDRADQLQPDGRRAGALREDRECAGDRDEPRTGAEFRDRRERRRRSTSAPSCWADRRQGLAWIDAERGPACRRTRPDRERARGRKGRGGRALHLHVRNDGPAQGGEDHQCPRARTDAGVRRCDRCASQTTASC